MAGQQHSVINTTFPVLLPDMPELRLAPAEFDAYIRKALQQTDASAVTTPARGKAGNDQAEQMNVKVRKSISKSEVAASTDVPESRFMTGLLAETNRYLLLDEHEDTPERENMMRTENNDAAYQTSGQPLVDLFFELEDVVSGDRLREMLESAWKAEPAAVLKIIWNARSIHLGKSSRNTFYRAVGWLAENHPISLLTNLPWLVRPLIRKKAPKQEESQKGQKTAAGASEGSVTLGDVEMVEKDDVDSDFEMIDEEDGVHDEPTTKKVKLDEDPALVSFDVKYGGAHGYWKDLLNILALAANGELNVDGDPRSVLNVEKVDDKDTPTPNTRRHRPLHKQLTDKEAAKKKYNRDWTPGRKTTRITERHERAVQKLQNDPFYKALHLAVARLFADQLQIDLARLESGSKAETKRLTLAAKWAPSHKGMHDQHTTIVSTIAELLYPFEEVCRDIDPSDRALYLKHARQAYQARTLSPLRKALGIVERPITANAFGEIKYDRVPSLAMKQYTPLFAKKDFANFDNYIENVAQGKARISGATLMPSTLIKEVSTRGKFSAHRRRQKKTKGTDDLVEQKLHDLQAKSLDGQWNTLVQRMRDSGTLQSSLAVCDVSGSMGSPEFPDGSSPMDSAIGLSLLLAEITAPPFGGTIITFSETPSVVRVGGPQDKRPLGEKVAHLEQSPWGMNTNFVAVFERLILPLAQEHKLTQAEMVKQVFVFSDMQFDSAQADAAASPWSTSYERVQGKFRAAGYDMPKLVFWNLAGGRSGGAAPKPVGAAEEGTVLVSGYSQGQMKMFLENGQFADAEGEVGMEEEGGEAGDVVLVTKDTAQTSLAEVRKAIGHEAYRMLKVVD